MGSVGDWLALWVGKASRLSTALIRDAALLRAATVRSGLGVARFPRKRRTTYTYHKRPE